MPDTASPTLSISREHSSRRVYFDTPNGESFRFGSQCGRNGRVCATAGVGLLATGLFLISQIGSTPALIIQLAILGSSCTVGGIGLIMRAVRDLLGRLVIDEVGIAIRPSVVGYSIAWNELSHWEVRTGMERYPDANTILLWTRDIPCAMFIPNNWLTDDDRIQVARCLRRFAADKESAVLRATK
ncbi:MAG: hypothetical protein U0941_22700 [Planctomycetaceae bacterium]